MLVARRTALLAVVATLVLSLSTPPVLAWAASQPSVHVTPDAPYLSHDDDTLRVESSAGLLDHVLAWSTFGAAVLAAPGVLLIAWNLRNARRQQRIASSPYVRVDIGPKDPSTTPDFAPPDPRFIKEDAVADLAVVGQPFVTFSAWLANIQSDDLGTSFSVTATFAIELRPYGLLGPEYRYSTVGVPYLEHGRPVKIDLFRVPSNWAATVFLLRLAFYDLYDEQHEHTLAQNENALYGRLSCTYEANEFYPTPEAKPAGPWNRG